MTKEEAIKHLQNMADHSYPNEEYMIAIKALKQEPCDDAISRQVVLEKAVYTETEEGWCGYTVGVNYIKSLPSVNPQPKTGYWIRGHHGFGCSNCHKSIEGEWDDNIDDITGTLFCPNCGAKMEKG